MKNVLVVTTVACLCSQVAFGQASSSFNYLVGTQTFEPKYQFSNSTRLVETAQAIGQMNSNVIKFSMAPNAFETYRLPKNPNIKSLRSFAELDPSMQSVLKSPFSYYFIWAYRHSAAENNYWRAGISRSQKEEEYREIYDFASYLLTTFAKSNKSFYLGHWEGDWSLLGGYDPNAEPSEVAIEGMIDWLNVRHKAVADARKAHPDSKAAIYSYCEVNLVTKAIAGKKTVTNSVLPKADVDLVSYSCWDSIDVSKGEAAMIAQVPKSLDYIQSKMKRPVHEGKGVFIGEFGFPLAVVKTQGAQVALSKSFIKASVEWGCPFILYWQIYENEANEGENGRGQGLIDNVGRKTRLHDFLQRFLTQSQAFVPKSSAESLQPNPSSEALRCNYCLTGRGTKWLTGCVLSPPNDIAVPPGASGLPDAALEQLIEIFELARETLRSFLGEVFVVHGA